MERLPLRGIDQADGIDDAHIPHWCDNEYTTSASVSSTALSPSLPTQPVHLDANTDVDHHAPGSYFGTAKLRIDPSSFHGEPLSARSPPSVRWPVPGFLRAELSPHRFEYGYGVKSHGSLRQRQDSPLNQNFHRQCTLPKHVSVRPQPRPVRCRSFQTSTSGGCSDGSRMSSFDRAPSDVGFVQPPSRVGNIATSNPTTTDRIYPSEDSKRVESINVFPYTPDYTVAAGPHYVENDSESVFSNTTFGLLDLAEEATPIGLARREPSTKKERKKLQRREIKVRRRVDAKMAKRGLGPRQRYQRMSVGAHTPRTPRYNGGHRGRRKRTVAKPPRASAAKRQPSALTPAQPLLGGSGDRHTALTTSCDTQTQSLSVFKRRIGSKMGAAWMVATKHRRTSLENTSSDIICGSGCAEGTTPAAKEMNVKRSLSAAWTDDDDSECGQHDPSVKQLGRRGLSRRWGRRTPQRQRGESKRSRQRHSEKHSGRDDTLGAAEDKVEENSRNRWGRNLKQRLMRCKRKVA